MKRNIKMLIAVLVVLALFAGGYFLLLKWEPESEKEETPDIQSESTEYLIDEETENIDYVQFNNGKETYIVRNGETPAIEGYSSHVIDTSKLSSAIYDSSSIAVSHKISGKADNLSEYGLDKAEKSVLIALKDGTSHRLLIGNSANFEGEYYAMLEGGDYVCTISSYEVDSLMVSPSEYRSLDICTLDSNSITAVSIEKNGKKEVSVKYDEEFEATNEYQTVSFKVTYPYSGVTASLDKLQSLFDNISSLSADSIAEENPSNLAKYGLDKPYTLHITDQSGETTVKMGSYGDGGSVYVMCNDVPVVYLAACPFYETVKQSKASDYVERFINLFNIETVQSIKLNGESESHTLEITKKSEDNYVYKKNGKLISEDNFKDIYQLIIGVTAAEFTSENPKGEEKCSITFNFTDKTSKTFTYYVYDERYSIVKADNGMICLALTKNLDNIFSKLK